MTRLLPLAALLLLVVRADAAERTITSPSETTVQRYLQATPGLLDWMGSLSVDPRTGEVVKQPTKPSGGGTRGTQPEPTRAPQPPAPEPLPYDLFLADDNGDSRLNRYLLAQLSYGVYGSGTNEADFKTELIDRFTPQGIAASNIDVLMDAPSGTEVAMFDIGNATVFAFRGTSSEGTAYPLADLTADVWTTFEDVELAGKNCRVHRGFWFSTDAVYDWVFARAADAYLDGQRIYLTGHSLGGARATVIAARLHYDEGLLVQGLHTFGAPKVGDENFASVFKDSGAVGVALHDVTQRFVVIGDPAPTSPNQGFVGVAWGKDWSVDYHQVGRLHQILPTAGTSLEWIEGDYAIELDVDLDSHEDGYFPTPGDWVAFASGGGQHMWYDDALLEAITSDPNFFDLGNLLLDHESVEQ
jgi:pimeloyl-ACP methyl ester carboxylesterase